MKLHLHQIISLVLCLIGVAVIGFRVANGHDTEIGFTIFLVICACSMVMIFIVPIPPPEILGLVMLLKSIRVKAEQVQLDVIPEPSQTTSRYATLESADAELKGYGFKIFGAYSSKNQENLAHTIWVYVDETGTILAELSANTFGIEIKTEFPDGFIVGTLVSNTPLNLDSKRFHVRSFTYRNVAYEYHLHQVNTQRSKHGEPIKFDTIENYLGDTQKEIRDKKAIHAAIGIGLICEGRRRVLAISQFIFALALMNLFPSVDIASGLTVCMIGLVFWIEDFTKAPLKVFQNGQATRKRKVA